MMNIRLFLLTSSILVLSHGTLLSQNKVAPSAYGQWLMYFGDNKINDKIGIHSELQLRNYFMDETVKQLLTRVGVNWYLDPTVMLSAGYGFIHTGPTDEAISAANTSEHRIWQQAVLRHKKPKWLIEHRYRLEQRFIENLDMDTEKYDNRLRYRFMALIPLGNSSSGYGYYFFTTYNELFVNLGRATTAEYFDRNRLYFAFGKQILPHMNMQVGYLNQVIAKGDHSTPDTNHNVQLGMTYNFKGLYSPKPKEQID